MLRLKRREQLPEQTAIRPNFTKWLIFKKVLTKSSILDYNIFITAEMMDPYMVVINEQQFHLTQIGNNKYFNNPKSAKKAQLLRGHDKVYWQNFSTCALVMKYAFT